MNQGKLFEEILKPVNRPNPYPLYAQLRKAPISQQEDGTYVVSPYRKERKSKRGAGELVVKQASQEPRSVQAFLFLDPPDHNRLRARGNASVQSRESRRDA